MSGPNGDPTISAEDGIINDDDDFSSEGNKRLTEQMEQFH